jgi:ADP-heptose:LPS heptosyltransferase
MGILSALGLSSCKNPKTIYLGRLQGVGDLILIGPTVVALREKFPQAEITFGCFKGVYYDIIANDPNIDKFDFPRHAFIKPKSKNVIKYIVRTLLYLKNRFLYNMKYDLVIFFYNYSREWNSRKHMIDQFSECAEVLLNKRRPIVYLNEDDISQAKYLLKKAGIQEDEKFIVLACETGAKSVSPEKHDPKAWDGFPELVEKIHQKYKIKILTLLPKSSRDGPLGTIRIKDEPTIRAGAAIIKQCSLFIGLDCGLTHVASAFDVEIVSIHVNSEIQIELYGALSPHTKFVSNNSFHEGHKNIKDEMAFVDRIMMQVEMSLEDVCGELKHL